MKRYFLAGSILTVSLLILSGCTPPAPENNTPKVDGSKYLLASEPPGAKGVIEARQNVKDKEEVVIVGRIGGDKNPWVEGRAAFWIVDMSAKACSDIEGDTCEQPWDYCCEKSLSTKIAFIQVVDDQSKPVKHAARELLKVDHLQTVVVQGIAQRDEKGNLTVLAKANFVKK